MRYYTAHLVNTGQPGLHMGQPLLNFNGLFSKLHHCTDHCNQQIADLHQELEKLNILDHPQRIIEICNQIRVLRNEIAGIAGD